MPVATWNSTQEDSVRYSPYTMPAHAAPQFRYDHAYSSWIKSDVNMRIAAG